jgi:hypothetical protein
LTDPLGPTGQPANPKSAPTTQVLLKYQQTASTLQASLVGECDIMWQHKNKCSERNEEMRDTAIGLLSSRFQSLPQTNNHLRRVALDTLLLFLPWQPVSWPACELNTSPC